MLKNDLYPKTLPPMKSLRFMTASTNFCKTRLKLISASFPESQRRSSKGDAALPSPRSGGDGSRKGPAGGEKAYRRGVLTDDQEAKIDGFVKSPKFPPP